MSFNMNGTQERFAQAGGEEGTLQESVEQPASKEGSPLMQLDPGVGIWAIVVFILLMLVLWKMAWAPIIAALENREKTIRESLEKANLVQQESYRIAEEQAKILSAAKSEAHAMLQSTKIAAEELRKKMEQSAQEEKSRILASAGREIEDAKNAAITELKKSTADLSLKIAEKLIQQSMDDAKHRQLVDRLIKEVSAET